MTISEDKLKSWSNLGAQKSSKLTYNSIKTCIDKIPWNEDISYNMYLQGSYRNHTNIRANSDIDVVLEFTSIFASNKSMLSLNELRLFNETYKDGKYSFSNLRSTVIEHLKEYYGDDKIKVGDKAIRVDGFNGRVDADVVCCFTYRNYRSFSEANMSDYIEGITFWGYNSKKEIVNYPNIHYDNGAIKNSNSNNKFKQAVRIIKNIKSKLIENNYITKNECPSYYIECLMYNVPNVAFNETEYFNIVFNILTFWQNTLKDNKLNDFVCQNERIYLFGESEQQWSIVDATKFINKSIEYWNNY